MLGETKAKELCEQVLRRCGKDAAEVILTTKDSALTRFANNSIHQNVAESDVWLYVRCILGKRSGAASTNRLEAGALDEVVERARASAQASPEDPDYPGLGAPSEYATVEAYDPSTARYSAEKRAQAAGIVCHMAAEKKLNASGAFISGASELAVANSQGVSAYHAATQADFQTVVMSEDSSGRARQSAWRAADLPIESLSREAIQKAELGRRPRPVQPGEYPVVFDPYVTHDLLSLLNAHGMGAQAVQEGHSWMNDRTGLQAMGSQVSIWDDGLDPDGLPLPFDFEGTPKRRVDIVRQGVVGGPVFDRATAYKAHTNSTGHAISPNFQNMGPLAANLFMETGDTSLEEMIRSTGRGLYISRFWYTRLVHPRDCVVTGMTRDGVFMIEAGELAYPVKNLRFTESYVKALAGVQAVSRTALLLTNDYSGYATRVPALQIGAFTFTGVTA